MMTTAHLMDFLSGQLADVDTGWSVGTFGAIAEFTRENAVKDRLNADRYSVEGRSRALG